MVTLIGGENLTENHWAMCTAWYNWQ